MQRGLAAIGSVQSPPAAIQAALKPRRAGAELQGAARRHARGCTDATTLVANTSKGLAAGALLVDRRRAQEVRGLLRELAWLKKGTNVTTPSAEQVKNSGAEASPSSQLLALHLNHAGASMVPLLVLEEGAAPGAPLGKEEATLQGMIAAGELHFAPGMRVGAKWNSNLPGWDDQAETPRFTLVELFAGIGGFRVGLGALGGRSVFASEIDPEAQEAYCRNFEAGLLAGDITDTALSDIPPHDMLTAGFCCQPFSKAGRQDGFGDPRGQLFYEVVRVLRHCRPATFLLENVANLLLHDGGNTAQEIMAELREAGYLVTHRVINSSTLLPQHRQRVYFVGFRSDLAQEFSAFRWPEMPLLGRTVGDILEPEGAHLEEHRLSDRQWDKIRSSLVFQEDPGRRAAMRHGPSRTLMAR
eukprot:CAMPEP_0117654448 /NCGR_PEP_ID=MMETSP0804-20121206/3749_1 /TAXON_ID=1074897 /ORGANISM="Tetraselmis astigmatica, Strain CCMP880" /LENGTH=413 /DNA_ID=CAMNT_0005460729 /DNA_START=40 /DNA_END=1281 /DNA_ORIENTATION=+